jgi:CheY-like chemotaxis protein
MSLGGSLEDLSLLDILQIVNVSRRTGVLRLAPPSMGTSFIYFAAGNVEDIVGDFSEEGFLAFFEDQDLVDATDLSEARERANGDSRMVLRRLLETGALNTQLLEQARRLEISRRLRNLTQISEGQFNFFLTEAGDELESSTVEPFSPLKKSVSPQNLLTQTLTEESLIEWAEPRRPEEAHGPMPASAAEDQAVQGPVPQPQAPPEQDPDAVLPEPQKPAFQPAQPRTFRMKPARNRITILLASDESIFRKLLQKRLLEHFADVCIVSSLNDYRLACTRFLADRTPFVTLVDLLMPTQSSEGYLGGLELIQDAHQRFPQVKIVLMTDLSDDRILSVARDNGALAVLPKPGLANLKVDEFEESIRSFADTFCAEVDKMIPPVEEEVASFLSDLGAETPGSGDRIRDQLSLLKGLMGELASPKESSEISLLVLRLAAEYFERSVLFLVRKDAFVGLGGFGETGDQENMTAKVRRLKISAGRGSFLDDAVKGRTSVQKAGQDLSPEDKEAMAMLGAYIPPTAVALPMMSRGRVIAMLYGDNAVSGQDLPDLTGMEIFMTQAGMAMEKALLEIQLLHMKRSIPIEKKDEG